jgi:hypothetical protein
MAHYRPATEAVRHRCCEEKIMLKTIHLVGCALVLTLSACATTRTESVASSTGRLEHNANVLARDAGAAPLTEADAPAVPAEDAPAVAGPAGTYPTVYARDARALALASRDLRHVVEGGYTDTDVQTAFDRVSRSYHAVRDEVEHSDSTQARADLQAVTEAYVDVEHALNIHAAVPVG